MAKTKRIRYPDKFNTKREMLWYIRGLMDAKQGVSNTLNLDIDRYRNNINFTEFQELR